MFSAIYDICYTLVSGSDIVTIIISCLCSRMHLNFQKMTRPTFTGHTNQFTRNEVVIVQQEGEKKQIDGLSEKSHIYTEGEMGARWSRLEMR